MKILKKIGRGVFYALIGVIVFWSLFMVIGRLACPTKYPMLFGYSEAGVISGSMEPAISQGDHVIFHRQDSYAVNDIVVYYDETDGAFVVHRLVGTDGDRFIAKGDYNPERDPEPVSRENIQGKVIYTIPNLQPFLYIGYGALATLLIQQIIKDIRSVIKKRSEEGGDQTDEKQSIENI